MLLIIILINIILLTAIKKIKKWPANRVAAPHHQLLAMQLSYQGGEGGREGKLHEITDEEEKRKTERRLFSGKYKNITKMATDINGGQPSKAIEEIIFKNMMKIMVNEFNK